MHSHPPSGSSPPLAPPSPPSLSLAPTTSPGADRGLIAPPLIHTAFLGVASEVVGSPGTWPSWVLPAVDSEASRARSNRGRNGGASCRAFRPDLLLVATGAPPAWTFDGSVKEASTTIATVEARRRQAASILECVASYSCFCANKKERKNLACRSSNVYARIWVHKCSHFQS